MVTLSSQPGGSKGFRMYIDGTLTAQMLPNTTYNGARAVRRGCAVSGQALF